MENKKILIIDFDIFNKSLDLIFGYDAQKQKENCGYKSVKPQRKFIIICNTDDRNNITKSGHKRRNTSPYKKSVPFAVYRKCHQDIKNQNQRENAGYNFAKTIIVQYVKAHTIFYHNILFFKSKIFLK